MAANVLTTAPTMMETLWEPSEWFEPKECGEVPTSLGSLEDVALDPGAKEAMLGPMGEDVALGLEGG